MVRLSKRQPNLMVSCGDENDLFVKLWNVSSSTNEPINQFQTNQIKHKYMAQGSNNEYYCVVTKTSELKIHKINYHQGVLKGVSIIGSYSIIVRESYGTDFAQKGSIIHCIR